MQFHTLDSSFRKDEIIDQFISAIWTERYSKAGDLTLVTELSTDTIAKLEEGTFIQLEGSDEVVQIDTALIENNTLKVTGNTLVEFLNDRIIRTSNQAADKYWNLTGKPLDILNTIVTDMTVSGPYIDGTIDAGVDIPKQIIPNLSVVSAVAPPDTDVSFAVPFGPLYDALAQIADTFSLGFRLYLDWANDYGYSLVFESYKGRDLTSSQTTYPVVRFSPQMDSLTNLSQLHSIAKYKTVAYAYAPSNPAGIMNYAGVAYAYPGAELETGFQRRVLMVFADDITTDMTGGDAGQLRGMLDQRAKDALANNNYIKVADGEVIPSSYIFGTDYGLGDIVELDSGLGPRRRARITEYIRSQDQSGERAYPTVSVLD